MTGYYYTVYGLIQNKNIKYNFTKNNVLLLLKSYKKKSLEFNDGGLCRNKFTVNVW